MKKTNNRKDLKVSCESNWKKSISVVKSKAKIDKYVFNNNQYDDS